MTEKSRRWGRAVVLTVRSSKHLRQRLWTTGFPPQLEGPHARLCDQRQCDNKHRFALPSTRRLQYKEVKVVKVPYSGSPSPPFSEISFYSFRRIRPVFDQPLSPLQIEQTRGSIGDMELNRKLEGGLGRQCVANAALRPSHLTSFRFVEHTFVVLVRPTESDNERRWAHRR